VNTLVSTVNRKRILAVGSPLVAAAIALGGPAACTQPPVRCHASGGEGIARYTIVGAAPDPTGACAQVVLPGTSQADPATFPLGVESYVPSPADPNAESEVSSLALQPEWIGARILDAQLNATQDPSLASSKATLTNYPYGTGTPPAPPPNGPPSTNFPYAWGKFDHVYPDAAGICRVSQMAASDMDYPDIPAHTYLASPPDPTSSTTVPESPETKVKYAWSNVRVYVSATAIGVQTFADLAVTQDGCAINYHVSILVPRIQCGTTDANNNTVADPTLCDPNPNGPNNPSGSGIAVGIKPSCENISTDPANPDFECLPPSDDPLSQLR
jgi:hypothetical protein